jgi:hypothetical protein
MRDWVRHHIHRYSYPLRRHHVLPNGDVIKVSSYYTDRQFTSSRRTVRIVVMRMHSVRVTRFEVGPDSCTWLGTREVSMSWRLLTTLSQMTFDIGVTF